MAGRITALVIQKKNKERVSVYIDEEFAFGLALIEAAKLKKGQTLTEADIQRLKALDEVEVAYDKALHFLSFRPRSEDEVRRNLKKKEISAGAIDRVIERLERAGFLNDAEFARLWAESRDAARPRSARALRYELRQKGVSDGSIEEAISDLDEDDAAYRAGQSKLRSYAGSSEADFKRRMGSFLARRGFGYDVVRDVVIRLWEESGEEAASDEAEE
jgi:regulatory protein